MQIEIKLHPNARKKGAKESQRGLEVYVHAQPEKNKANKELIDLLAKTWRIPKSNITIIKGTTSRQKTLTIADEKRPTEELQQILIHEVGI